jgi:trehalose/maltose transport system substrate-binding protein
MRLPTGWRRPVAAVAAAALTGALVTACGSNGSSVPVVNLYAYSQQSRPEIIARCNQQAAGRYRIVLNILPRTADQQREQLVRRLAAGDHGMDVLGIDVTWTAELAKAGWIREWTGANAEQARNGTLPAPLTTAVVDGKLYAATNNTNVQLLWYLDNLVPKAPTTWSGLMSTAASLAGQGKPHYVEVTGAQYEGLVVWFNSMVASAGGSILNAAGTEVSLGAPAERGLTVMRDFANSKAADPSLSNTQEDPARLAVEGGTAAMELNWPYVYASMAADKPAMLKHFKWAPYPGIDGAGRATIGGENYAVSSYSDHPADSFQAALCLRSADSQKYAAIKGGVPPTLQSVYDDDTPLDASKPVNATTNPSMDTAYPMKADILASLRTAASRPVTATYQNVSTVTSAILSPPSAIRPASTLRALRSQISDALQSKGVLP